MRLKFLYFSRKLPMNLTNEEANESDSTDDTELDYPNYFIESVDSAKKIGSISLDLSRSHEFSNRSSEGFHYLANQLRDSNFENINLFSGIWFDDDPLIALSAVLKDTKIKNLNLTDCEFGRNGLLALSSALKESQIEILNLSNNESIEKEINILTDLTDSLPSSNVTSLNLSGINISCYVLKHLSDTLASSQITILNLMGCGLDNEGVEHLSSKLSNSRIQSLHLSCENMSFANLQSLADVLEASAITELDIAGSNIGTIGATYLAGKLIKSRLQNLDIGFNQIGSVGSLALGNVIHLTKIIKLNLAKNSIESIGIMSLAQNLKESKLKHLDLEFNNLGINGAQILANGITDSDLEYLNINSNYLGNVGMGIILDALEYTKITDFDLDCESNDMSLENMKLVTNAFKCFKLKNLNLRLPPNKNTFRIFFKELKTLIESNKLDDILSIKNKMNFSVHSDELCPIIKFNNEENDIDAIKHFCMKKLLIEVRKRDFNTFVFPIIKMLIDIKNPISNLTTLRIKGSGIGDKGARILAKNFKYLKLTRLAFDGDSIKNDGVMAIAQELKNSQIRCLHLGGSSFDSVTANYLINVVKTHPIYIAAYDSCDYFSTEEKVVFENIKYMFLKAQHLIQSVSDNSPLKYDTDLIEHLKAHEIFKNLDLLWDSEYEEPKYDSNQINSINSQIRYNTTKNFLKIIGVVNSDEIDSDLLPTEIIIKICSYLKINDIKFNQ